MNVSKLLSQIPEEDKTPLVLQLLEIIQIQAEEIQCLRDEIARLKGQKPKPQIKPSKLEPTKNDDDNAPVSKGRKSGKRSKTPRLKIHETIEIQADHPPGSKFKGHQKYGVQDLIIEAHTVEYWLERWEGPDGENYIGKLPEEVRGHFGNTLKCFILNQYYQAHVTQPLILEQLWDLGIEIASGTLNAILIENKAAFHAEKEAMLEAGLEASDYIQVDDTSARHKGKNGYCTHIGNEYFACFESTESKSRINFLKVLRAGREDYVLNPEALAYMTEHKFPAREANKLSSQLNSRFEGAEQWEEFLAETGIHGLRHVQIATEGALIGSIVEHGINPELVVISDDAGQFDILCHGLCWIHAERSVRKLIGYNADQTKALEQKRTEIWEFYQALKSYKAKPDEEEKERLKALFDKIFTEKPCFASLNKALEGLHRNRDELLLVLERPEIPLHNNLSERDIREYVKRRKVSGSTRSSAGRRCRDPFTSLKKTCQKLGISFWD